VRWQIWQRVTGNWVTVTGKRREGDLLICFYDASSTGVILPSACAARTPRGMSGQPYRLLDEDDDKSEPISTTAVQIGLPSGMIA
jgi:hypothetical protein